MSFQIHQPGPYIFGETITFDVNVPKQVKNPFINVRAYQGGTLVWAAGGVPGDSFHLGGDGSQWTAGAAQCSAQLYDVVWHAGQESVTTLAALNFEVTA